MQVILFDVQGVCVLQIGPLGKILVRDPIWSYWYLTLLKYICPVYIQCGAGGGGSIRQGWMFSRWTRWTCPCPLRNERERKNLCIVHPDWVVGPPGTFHYFVNFSPKIETWLMPQPIYTGLVSVNLHPEWSLNVPAGVFNLNHVDDPLNRL